ncbi:hypothetical protein, partial [uncultured Thioclava sp.]|uniref:hypothetical protein n=1 Tax=uncultured Thioclava sp. TaxID=473858 RepID=UPI0025E617AE
SDFEHRRLSRFGFDLDRLREIISAFRATPCSATKPLLRGGFFLPQHSQSTELRGKYLERDRVTPNSGRF